MFPIPLLTACTKYRKGCCGWEGMLRKVCYGDWKSCSWEWPEVGSTDAHTASTAGVDAHRFDKANESNAFQEFVALMPSEEPIEAFSAKLHPWADDPRTVGVLCIAQLASVASDRGNATATERIREAGAIPALVFNLKSPDIPRLQHAVVALSFLTPDKLSAEEAFDAGAMELLLTVQSHSTMLLAAAATTIRNMFVLGPRCNSRFVELGGIEYLLEQIARAFEGSRECWNRPAADTLLEAVLNLQDCIEPDDGPIMSNAKVAVGAGAVWELERVLAVSDEDIRATAAEILAILRQACPESPPFEPARPVVALTLEMPLDSARDGPYPFRFRSISGAVAASLAVDPTLGFNSERLIILAKIMGVPVWRVRVILPSGALLTTADFGRPIVQLLSSYPAPLEASSSSGSTLSSDLSPN